MRIYFIGSCEADSPAGAVAAWLAKTSDNTLVPLLLWNEFDADGRLVAQGQLDWTTGKETVTQRYTAADG